MENCFKSSVFLSLKVSNFHWKAKKCPQIQAYDKLRFLGILKCDEAAHCRMVKYKERAMQEWQNLYILSTIVSFRVHELVEHNDSTSKYGIHCQSSGHMT